MRACRRDVDAGATSKQWRSQGGARPPPKLKLNVFFLQLISGNLEVTRKRPKKSPELK